MHRMTLLLSTAILVAGCQPATDSASTADGPDPTPWDWSEETVRSAVNQVRAGRDLNPDEWPGGARVAEGVPASFFFPAWSLKLAPEQAEVINASGMHEIAVHGWIHERNSELDAPTEERLLVQAIESIEEITGRRPVGYRAPSWNFSPNTLDIVRRLGLLYESSLMADDRPYELVADGVPTGMVELPVEWILDDAPLFNPRGDSYASPRDVMQVWIDEFDKAWEEGTMFLLTMHPHISGHRSRIVALEGLIEHMKAKGGVWFGTHEEAALYVREQAGMNE